MGVIVVDLFVTLDGVYQSPGSRDEDAEGGFPFGGWQGAYFDAESGAAIGADIERVDALLLGRKTYDIWAAYWPFQSDDIGARFNAVPKFVASHSLTEPSWAGTTVVTDVAAEVRGIRDRFDETHVFGSGDLVRTLLREELVDRINLWLYPLALGTGKRLFAEGTVPAAFSLVEPPVAFPKGSIQLVYERAGEPVTGVDMSTIDEAGA
ncbi:dihydrofolate reductase [Agromyces hippuratus]|uniref:Dihydrofolate reductase n=1 Tax=Agromyces hippuratus TaxID=286438 RepID=A0A852X4W3_9MICO|nr:dihydrofolate reductase family protein [Agromyces hippuratus]NYG22554.1 dihydrofolate reductase [Agromyces hippuratus]